MSKVIQFCSCFFLIIAQCIATGYMLKEDFPALSYKFDEQTVHQFIEREFSSEKIGNFIKILREEEEKMEARKFFESIPREQPKKTEPEEKNDMEELEQPKKAEPKEEEEIPKLPPPKNPDYRPHWAPSPGLTV